ncbi:MFS transporter [Rhodococcus sp. BP-252]|nr:MFS transporter [Rhodococcus sp. BP-320]MBY6417131.1 MFS transporter [Rhodococcus sp. BP-321]MBY6423219.1 MFS transporter [Rhodococcus sp. BP-324]MBY6427155.1 MFS transporter [Rhodococcus sp. BP-323]MBY6432232.1 MFS transporter [Rhodococcus sp. BP-322]MBY6441129.1 MFS transporter [Rhodococcus sp. BP-319]MBY6446269.1 MFS transporter [Rhodococcus sp. BP-318]MBY6451068.1 MFS transporter [Rhodococcus sp. BP-315]MBY6455696.1 MFS transporter [Rhodococcus sp. BP-277]MBY6460531.1 MFS transporte
MDVLTAIKKSPISRYQYKVLAACLLVITIDGFDVFVMGFVLPHLPDGFFDGNAEKGYLLSAGLAGMAVGSIFLAPLADRIGRRRLILWGLVINLAGLVASAMSPNVEALIAARFVTGIGIGGMAASLIVLVQEMSSEKRRNTIMGVYSIGFPLGSLVGGGIGALLVAAFDGAWQVMFVFGAIITAGAVVVTVAMIPESVDFLINRNTPEADARIRSFVAKLNNPTIDPNARPALAPVVENNASVRGLFAGGTYYRTLLTWVMYSCLMSAFYFANTWTPQLVKESSGSADLGTTAGLILSFGGLVGALVFGAWTLKISAGRLLWTSMAIAAVAILAFASLFGHPGIAIALTVAVGLFTYIAITAAAAVVPFLYPVGVRSTAIGWMLGIGRLFSISAPIAVGYALAVFAPQTLYYFSAVPMAVGAVATYLLWKHTRGESAPTTAVAESISGHPPFVKEG